MLALAAVLIMFHCVTDLDAQTIQIKLVDGKSGRAVTGACVGVWMSKTKPVPVFIPTDKNGVAWLRLTQKDSQVKISHDPKLGCGGTGAINPVLEYGDTLTAYSTGQHPSCAFSESVPNARWKEMDFSTKKVLQDGVASANTCGKVTASLQPGEVILFVRPRSFHEKVHDWENSEAFPL